MLTFSENLDIRGQMSSIDFQSYQQEPTLVQQKNENVLCGRDWIEEHLNYERRHLITDAQGE